MAQPTLIGIFRFGEGIEQETRFFQKTGFLTLDLANLSLNPSAIFY